MAPLFADIGNSTIKIARLVNGSIERLSYTDHQSAPTNLLSSVSLLSNVGMSLTKQREQFGDCPSVHDLLEMLPLSIAYTNPKQLGQDRIAAMMAAWYHNKKKPQRKGSFAVIDFGSCVTTDIVNSNGKHLGGNIDLGLLWRLRAAHTFSENLPMVDVGGAAQDLDGFLARKYDATSQLGEILDPISDKILIVFCFFGLAVNLSSYLIGFVASMILSRELWVSALRDLNARNNNQNATKVTYIAKIKTSIQIFTISLYLFALAADIMLLVVISDIFLIISLLITLYSGIEYTINSFKLNKIS